MHIGTLKTPSFLWTAVLVALVAAPLWAQATADDLQDAIDAVRRERAVLEQKLEALRKKELALEKELAAEKKQGHYVRIEVKGRLQIDVIPNLFSVEPDDDMIQPTIVAGSHKYTLSWNVAREEAIKMAKTLNGKTVIVTGRLRMSADTPPVLMVESLKADQ